MNETMQEWRRDFHAHPETAYEEVRTSRRVAELLESWGLEVLTGLGGTGVAGILTGRLGEGESLILRADMDGLNLSEATGLPHSSRTPGKMHGCGHDGHTAMLLGAARDLAASRDFRGRVVFLFQPAEENEAGAERMIREGLFERVAVDRIFSLHNWPGLPAGQAAVHAGAVMGAVDFFEIRLRGRGGHAAMPDGCRDSLPAAAQIILGIQTLRSREWDPFDPLVLSLTQVQAGESPNVIPEEVVMKGTCRSFSAAARDFLETRLKEMVRGICAAHGLEGETTYLREYPATVNRPGEADLCAGVLKRLLGEDRVHRELPPSACGEDFAFFLRQKPGAYIWLGSGREGNNPPLHSPEYDFNDGILETGRDYWIALVREILG